VGCSNATQHAIENIILRHQDQLPTSTVLQGDAHLHPDFKKKKETKTVEVRKYFLFLLITLTFKHCLFVFRQRSALLFLD